ncbi:MAG TPA: hypothetical protein IAB71_02200 [Candidatus Scatomonas pullistercoris]|uniref:Uncharacterized protein n=1 Tax=Candidatus Scatomonas pullistercoris TaxID=2840920 RepID=A0A9D1P245_9FIRM|nr:hypothetical protein [Candidatus Scatomonas pullistercoris]
MEKQETGNTGSNRNTPEPGRQFTVTQGYLKDHIYMGVQKRSGSRILKKDFLNVELYLWIELETDHPEEGVLAFKMPAWFPGACRLPEEALWAAAGATDGACLHIILPVLFPVWGSCGRRRTPPGING